MNEFSVRALSSIHGARACLLSSLLSPVSMELGGREPTGWLKGLGGLKGLSLAGEITEGAVLLGRAGFGRDALNIVWFRLMNGGRCELRFVAWTDQRALSSNVFLSWGSLEHNSS